MGHLILWRQPSWLLLLVWPLNVLPAPSLGQVESQSHFYDGRHNDLSVLPQDIPLDTQILYLSYNNLTVVPDRAFSDLRSLATVDLAFNGINHISPKSFLETRVSSLDLCWNQLESFPDLRTIHSTLTFLDVCRNRVRNIPTSSLQGLRLKSLDLSNNEIAEFPDLSYIADTLTVLDLSYNPIGSINPQMLSRLSNLERLYLENCRLTSVPDFSLMPIPNAMKELHLSRNQISKFQPRVLKTLSALTELFLAHNQLESVPQSTLTGLTSLDSLDLSHNRLNHLPDIRSIQHSLTFLDLSHNDLSRLTETDVPALVTLMDKLDYLVIKDAHLRILGDLRSAVRQGADLHLDISGNNDLVCDCRLSWIKQSSIVKDLKPESRPCGEPQKYRGARWDSITAQDLCAGEAVPEATPAPDKKALMEDQNLFPNSVENKAPGPAPAVDPLVEPIPLRENEDHWDTVHISPVIITKDVDWSFLTDHLTLLCVVGFGTFLWLGIAVYVCVTTRKRKLTSAKDLAKSPAMMVSEPGAVTFVYRQQETKPVVLKQIAQDT